MSAAVGHQPAEQAAVRQCPGEDDSIREALHPVPLFVLLNRETGHQLNDRLSRLDRPREQRAGLLPRRVRLIGSPKCVRGGVAGSC